MCMCVSLHTTALVHQRIKRTTHTTATTRYTITLHPFALPLCTTLTHTHSCLQRLSLAAPCVTHLTSQQGRVIAAVRTRKARPGAGYRAGAAAAAGAVCARAAVRGGRAGTKADIVRVSPCPCVCAGPRLAASVVACVSCILTRSCHGRVRSAHASFVSVCTRPRRVRTRCTCESPLLCGVLATHTLLHTHTEARKSLCVLRCALSCTQA